MRGSFNLTIDDWVAFQQYQRSKKTPFYNVVYPLILCLGIALVAINVYHIYMYEVNNTTWFSSVVLIGLLYVLYIRKKALSKVREVGLDLQQKHPEAFGPMRLEMNANEFTIQSQETAKTILWEDMKGFEENKCYFFLYSKKGVVYIVPKRGIEDISGFRSELTNNIE
ncbi:MAG: YcxB family protein [Dysgonamonadaceae bacterium]|jgi:hypothetical protein|nr:YcxB family protein [Dysgonamonadaceae bacterium]